MFGYVKPFTAELLVKEYTLYKAIYCGLCRTGGKRISRLTRLFLSYDFTALAALRLALEGEEPKICKKFCFYSMRKKPALDCDGVFTYTAAAFACLSFCKTEDDIQDEKGFKRFKKMLVYPLFRRMNKKAAKLYPDLYEKLKAHLAELARLEGDSEKHSLDTYADNAAKALAHIAAYGLEGVAGAIAYEAGYHIGRYIYIIDAVDDLKADSENGRFNPLIRHYGSYESAVAKTDEIAQTLRASGVRFSAAVGLAEASVYTDILQNIAHYGMEKTVGDIYDKYAYTRKESEEL
ncbi:MAG: hypothetical protein IJB65_00080 [Clostridia bacterium]|nr:hypothetical protein [Clostridia bacterium]